MEERIKIYMGDAYDRPFRADLSNLTGNQKPYSFCFDDLRTLDFPLTQTTYYHDLTRFIYPYPELYKKTFLFYPHDRVEPFTIPTLVKSRPITERGCSILMNMNFARHFKPVFEIDSQDIKFEDKKDVLIWRGGCTGYGFGNDIPFRTVSRQNLVEMYYNSPSSVLDIGLAEFNRKKYNDFTAYEKPSLNIEDQLTYKFILSVEGNDVATNLKWILKSNSVPVCPPFAIQSWILEDRLIPYEHFLPIRKDFLDLEDKIEWAIHHPKICKQMVNNGKQYIHQFLDMKTEEQVRKTILFRYAKNVKC